MNEGHGDASVSGNPVSGPAGMGTSPLEDYLSSGAKLNNEFAAYIANLAAVAKVSPAIAASTVQELEDQRSNLKLIASENYCSLSTQLAMGNLLTDKYCEGFPFHRFYAGCDNVDAIEALACEQACKLFGAEHAYVQPHSGADANVIAYVAILHARIGPQVLDVIGKKKLTDLSEDEWTEFRDQLANQRLFGLGLKASQ